MITKTLDSIQVRVLDKRICSLWPLPQYQTDGSAAMDLIACIDNPLTLKPASCELIATGISIFIMDSGFCAKILPRSGLGHKHGVVLGNGTGLIDSDYQGPLMISCLNRSQTSYQVQPGERIAQLVFLPLARPELTIVQSFDQNVSERGEDGFGSTGK
jgi:dUTP pyrophosphatase